MDRDRLIEGFHRFVHRNIWSRFGRIGPNTLDEAKAVHRGLYLGFVKIWTPRGLYRLSRKYQKLGFEEFEDRQLQYEAGVALGAYSFKMGTILVALEIGRDPLSKCGEALRFIR